MSALNRIIQSLAADPDAAQNVLRQLNDEQRKVIEAICDRLPDQEITPQSLADVTGMELDTVRVLLEQTSVTIESQISVFRIQRQLVDAIERVRKERGITMRKLAETLNMSAVSVRRLLRGHSRMQMDRLVAICHALEIDISEFFPNSPAQYHEIDPVEQHLANDTTPIAGPLRVYIDSNAYTAEEKGELLSLVSELFQLQANDRLVIDHKGTAEPVPSVVLGPHGGAS